MSVFTHGVEKEVKPSAIDHNQVIPVHSFRKELEKSTHFETKPRFHAVKQQTGDNCMISWHLATGRVGISRP
jgi:hypothetical protein